MDVVLVVLLVVVVLVLSRLEHLECVCFSRPNPELPGPATGNFLWKLLFCGACGQASANSRATGRYGSSQGSS